MNVAVIVAKLKQYPIAVISVGIAMVFAILIFFRGGLVTERETTLVELESRFQLIQRNVINSNHLAANVDEIKAMVADVESRLIKPSNTVANTRYFLSLENQAGVKINDPSMGEIRTPNPRGLPNLTHVSYTLTVNGDFNSVVDLLYLLHTGEHFSRVQSFSIARGRGGSTLTAIINLQFLGTK